MNEKIKIVEVAISQLKPAKYNPRRLTAKQETDLTNSIKEFGLIDPIIINGHPDRKNIIIGGHARYKIAKQLNYKKIPAIYLNLSIEQERVLNLRLNKNTGEWDLNLLKEFPIETLLETGFDDSDLSSIWDEHLETENDDFSINKEIENAKKTNIKLGDMFKLGNSVLICGNCEDEKVLQKLLGKDKVDMIYIDPPFDIGLDYSKGICGSKNYGGLVNDKKGDIKYREFIKKSLINGLSVSKKDLHCFCYCDPLKIGMIQEIYKELGIINKRVLIWLKNNQNPTPKIAFNRIYEPVIYGIANKPYLSDIKNTNEILNKEVENGNRTLDDVLDLIDIWLVKRLPSNQYLHPTEKNPTLHEKALKRCTKINDIVLDMFGGSGSTLIACEQLKRRCFMVEINPIFCQLIINRYETYANKKARRIN